MFFTAKITPEARQISLHMAAGIFLLMKNKVDSANPEVVFVCTFVGQETKLSGE